MGISPSKNAIAAQAAIRRRDGIDRSVGIQEEDREYQLNKAQLEELRLSCALSCASFPSVTSSQIEQLRHSCSSIPNVSTASSFFSPNFGGNYEIRRGEQLNNTQIEQLRLSCPSFQNLSASQLEQLRNSSSSISNLCGSNYEDRRVSALSIPNFHGNYEEKRNSSSSIPNFHGNYEDRRGDQLTNSQLERMRHSSACSTLSTSQLEQIRNSSSSVPSVSTTSSLFSSNFPCNYEDRRGEQPMNSQIEQLRRSSSSFSNDYLIAQAAMNQSENNRNYDRSMLDCNNDNAAELLKSGYGNNPREGDFSVSSSLQSMASMLAHGRTSCHTPHLATWAGVQPPVSIDTTGLRDSRRTENERQREDITPEVCTSGGDALSTLANLSAARVTALKRTQEEVATSEASTSKAPRASMSKLQENDYEEFQNGRKRQKLNFEGCSEVFQKSPTEILAECTAQKRRLWQSFQEKHLTDYPVGADCLDNTERESYDGVDRPELTLKKSKYSGHSSDNTYNEESCTKVSLAGEAYVANDGSVDKRLLGKEKVEVCLDLGSTKCVKVQKKRGRRYVRKPCSEVGCIKYVYAAGKCVAHGGGKRCSKEGCTKTAYAGGKCIAHGGGTRCSEEGCNKSAQARGKCTSHGGHRKECSEPGCTTSSQFGGKCVVHGGGKKCSEEGCKKSALKGGKCASHGGGRRCPEIGCTNFALKGGKCAIHGGSKICSEPGCNFSARSRGKCIDHGGYHKKCSKSGCTKYAQAGGKCGGKSCKTRKGSK
mmetsp:Transcript_16660/g.33168  ORF Transcript_16660/g.33168 Transcript_16660/m.33168 type:complete len:765 (-) Transcript_16660:256-2550(-)